MIKGRKRAASLAGDDVSHFKSLKSTKTDESSSSSSYPKTDLKPNGSAKFNKFSKPTGKPFNKKTQASGAATEKTDWHKFKQDKKDLKLKRKRSKDTFELCMEAKQIYEKLKCKKTEKKAELVGKLYSMLKGDNLKKVVMAHDTARIVQCMLKFASLALRDTISEELLPIAVDMAVSKYSHFCILRMFKYGSPGIKTKLVDSLLGNIVRLAGHNISSKILDHVYLTVASQKQKIYMRQEFYGDLYKKSKDNSVKELADAYKDAPHMKAAVLGSVKSNLDHMANKNLVDSSLIHAVILEYVKECDDDKREEIITTYSGLIPLLLTTKEGCQAAVLCFWHSTPKNRRAIVKAIKEHLVKICTHEHGYVFIIAVINSLDDTKATKKAIFDPIYAELKTIAANQWGRRVIEWFVSPADKNGFHPQFIAYIDEGLKYGKKDKDVRRQEIFEEVESPLAKAIAQEPEFWFADGHIGLVTANIINKLTSTSFTSASHALVSHIFNHDWTATVIEETEEPKTVAGIEDAGLHIALKKIIKNDVERTKRDQETFGKIMIGLLRSDIIAHWLTVNRGCFILLNVIENNSDEVTKPLEDILTTHIAILKKQSTPGGKLLLKKLEY